MNMSLFSGMFGDPQDDPIFGSALQPMNMMDPFSMMSPFGGFGNRQSLMPFGFPDMNTIMNNFKHQMNGAMTGANCHSYSSSTMMTMSSGPDGRPLIYQESSSTRTAPGGIKETKKAVCDSRTGTKRLAIGRHIGERGHVKERVQNMSSGVREETDDYINIEEDEAEHFDREWGQKAGRRTSHERAALTYRSRDQDYGQPLAITAGPSARLRNTMPHNTSYYRDTGRHGAAPFLRSYSPESHDGPIIEEVDDEVVTENPRKRRRERPIPEITEVNAAEEEIMNRKMKQRSRKYQNN